MDPTETSGEIAPPDAAALIDKIDAWIDGAFRLLPNLGVALVVLLLFWLVSKGVQRGITAAATRRDRLSLGAVLGSLVGWALMILGFMLAATVVLPSVSPGDLFASLGIGSVAIGFAFKDILQNLLAGVLILIRQPFAVGDQIVSGGYEGTVERIETRATILKTYDNRRVVIPNSDIYTDAVVVMTAFEHVRSEYDVMIGCSDDWDQAIGILEETLRGVEGVLDDPAPEALPWDLAADGNVLRLRWWTLAPRADVVRVRAQVIRRAYTALAEAGIDLPYPTRVVLFHDQTEDSDGDRTRQREGWPAGAGTQPKAARISAALSRAD